LWYTLQKLIGTEEIHLECQISQHERGISLNLIPTTDFNMFCNYYTLTL
jgi:hypothetical protein